MSRLLIAFALAAGGVIAFANAQTLPPRHVTLVVPLATGGSSHTIGHIVAEGLRPHPGHRRVHRAGESG